LGEKKKVYHALVDGATSGLSDGALYEFVQKECGKTSSKKIVRASLLALSDPDLRDGNVLNTIYALAIKHRLDQIAPEDHQEIQEVEVAPSIATKDKVAAAPKPRRVRAKPAAAATNAKA